MTSDQSQYIPLRVEGNGERTAVLAVILEHLVDFVANLAFGNFDIILGGTVVVHKRQEAIIGDVELLEVNSGSLFSWPDYLTN